MKTLHKAALIGVALALYSTAASAQLTNQGMLDQVVTEFATRATSWQTVVMNAAMFLFWTLGTISLVFTFGFMALLGTIALFGMIMRNSVILVDQIEQDLAAGKARWEAIVESTVRRFRPIVLTAAAAVLAMIPLSRNDFFGPMAVAIMGGLIVATALTLLFLPALYAAWYRTPVVGRSG